MDSYQARPQPSRLTRAPGRSRGQAGRQAGAGKKSRAATGLRRYPRRAGPADRSRAGSIKGREQVRQHMAPSPRTHARAHTRSREQVAVGKVEGSHQGTWPLPYSRDQDTSRRPPRQDKKSRAGCTQTPPRAAGASAHQASCQGESPTTAHSWAYSWEI